MSRTYRRRGEHHEYRWALRDWSDAVPYWARVLLDLHSKEGRRAIARFHSDKEVTMGGAAQSKIRGLVIQQRIAN